ncbi:MAG TPA: hypothetical protein VIF11_16865 [Methylomirabilota bacterium]
MILIVVAYGPTLVRLAVTTPLTDAGSSGLVGNGAPAPSARRGVRVATKIV